MSEIRTDVIKYPSSNNRDTVSARIYTCEGIVPKAILQISHGMCEYIDRYAEFAEYMARRGYVVCGNDHLGHGETSGTGTDGYFGESGARWNVVQDLHKMNELAKQMYPELPVILLGHSMGSFLARMYAEQYAESICALILVGTGGPLAAAKVGIALTALLSALKGPRYRSNLINRMAFGQYCRRIAAPNTPYDWISRDEMIVRKYAADPKCTFVFTVSAFHELMRMTDHVNRKRWANAIDHTLPVLLIAGREDPVGNYGAGVRKVYEMLRKAGVRDVQMKLYEGARHEILNEINRPDVYQDVLRWCDTHVPHLDTQ